MLEAAGPRQRNPAEPVSSHAMHNSTLVLSIKIFGLSACSNCEPQTKTSNKLRLRMTKVDTQNGHMLQQKTERAVQMYGDSLRNHTALRPESHGIGPVKAQHRKVPACLRKLLYSVPNPTSFLQMTVVTSWTWIYADLNPGSFRRSGYPTQMWTFSFHESLILSRLHEVRSSLRLYPCVLQLEGFYLWRIFRNSLTNTEPYVLIRSIFFAVFLENKTKWT